MVLAILTAFLGLASSSLIASLLILRTIYRVNGFVYEAIIDVLFIHWLSDRPGV
jgi:hypothetical protein